MMDFEDAAQRLARDQKKLRGRKVVAVSAKAKREADYRKKQQEQKRQERVRQQKQRDFIQQFMTACDRSLGVKQLSSPASAAGTNGGGLQLNATSIHGEGDKLALPPSVLERLTQSMAAVDDASGSSPWLFRIGILNPDYTFPASVLLQTLKANNGDDDDDDDSMHNDSEDEDNEAAQSSKAAYLDELGHKYISYTHGTVVEFTQEEGDVGLPAPMAAALLDPNRRLTEHSKFTMPTKRTKDPSPSTKKMDAIKKIITEEDAESSEMETDDNDRNRDENLVEDKDDTTMEKTQTPGHIAYGAFDVPDMPLEITMVKLPKGKGCTLTPTHEAIRNGFYNLQDVKVVLEQSLIRTRATLSVGDTVQTWHRGNKFDLKVSKVLPSTYGAITCINTDIEVDLGEVKDYPEAATATAQTGPSQSSTATGGHTLSGGRVLSSSPELQAPKSTTPPSSSSTVKLLPEPPKDKKDGICTVQLRADGGAPVRRRFDVQAATLQDLFAFAKSVVFQQNDNSSDDPFRLVTRFPRKVYELNGDNSSSTMSEAGIQSGQELLMVERV